MSRLSGLSSNPLITEYSQGAAQQNINPVAEFIAPTVPVAKAVSHFKKWNDKTTLVIPDTRRALRGKATVVGFDLSDASTNCQPNALDFPVDIEEKDELDGIVAIVQEGADIVAQLSGMAHEQAVVNLAVANATAGTALDSTSGSADLVDIVDQMIIATLLGAKGWGSSMEIRMVWGLTGLRKFKNHASVKDRFKTTGNKGASVNPTNEQIASLFVTNVNIKTSTLVVDSNTSLDAASNGFLINSDLLIFASVPNPTRFDTSFMKTFRKRGAYMVPRFFQSEDGRVQFAGFDWSEEIQVTNAGASRKCAIT